MKSYLKYTFFIAVIVFYSCAADNEKEDNPTPNGTTQPDFRNVYVGTWVCNEQSTVFGTTTYSVDITKHTTIASRIVASNFYNLGFANSNAQFEISGNSISIFQQTISGYNVVGSGTIANSSTMNLSYATDDGSGIDSVTAVYTKN